MAVKQIVHVTHGLDVGGLERLLVEFARHADKRRFALHFVSLGSRGPLADSIEDLGWEVTALDGRPGIRPGLIFRLARLFRGADIVHTHDDRPLVYGCLAAKLARVRVFVHTHHHGVLPQVTQRQNSLVRFAARLPNHFVCVSEDSARAMAEVGVPATKIRVIPNGIDLARFPFHGPQVGGPVVTVARLSPEKDIGNLLRAAALVKERLPDVRIEIAGAGPSRDELEHLKSDLHLQDEVHFLGEVKDVPSLLGRAGLFVLPSRTEGISLTLLEAMARGLPVVTTRVGGNPEVVDDGTTGLLVPPEQPVALAEGMLNLLGNFGRAQHMGVAARQRAETHFDIRAMVEKYETLYTAL